MPTGLIVEDRGAGRRRWRVAVGGIGEVSADVGPGGDGVACGQADDPEPVVVGVDDPGKVATNPHHDTTVATIEATGLTSTGTAMALECTHTPIGSRVFHAPTTRPGCSAPPMPYSGSLASRVWP